MSKRKSKRPSQPIALTIAGSDSGGGAGIQADLKTFAALGVHGTSAITCLTAQNPRGVRGVQPASARIVRQQIEAVFDEVPPRAVKTGMLFSSDIIREVVRFFARGKRPPLIVDPVMVATSGARLLNASALKALTTGLLPLAALATPNRHEAEVLVGKPLRSVDDLRLAAPEIHTRFGCAALVKGGHLKVWGDAVDVFYNGEREMLLGAPFVEGPTHGTGCTLSAAIAGYVALGCDLPYAVQMAKKFITLAIKQSVRAEGHSVLNPFWEE
ncbi:MAG TPA: bifunctional hydroxymethylpyrimidine kinase/phosphomethylpyrimidine kinase [Verrucomicrobiae bacterium]